MKNAIQAAAAFFRDFGAVYQKYFLTDWFASYQMDSSFLRCKWPSWIMYATQHDDYLTTHRFLYRDVWDGVGHRFTAWLTFWQWFDCRHLIHGSRDQGL